MVASSAGLVPESDCPGNAQKQITETNPPVWEGAPQQETRNCETENGILEPDTKTDFNFNLLVSGDRDYPYLLGPTE
jgi:hypothetical protein